jgi:putative flippase GtrA
MTAEAPIDTRLGPGWARWWKFNAVGAIGVVVQLAASAFFYRVLELGLVWSPALAVECAVLHNFLWHERWTWRDRARSGSPSGRLLRFNLSAGLISIVCNVAGTPFLVGKLGVRYLVANIACIAVGALANFFAADWFAFR